MNDFEKILKDVEERLQGVELKIKKKLDSIDRVVNDKLKAHGFGWDDDDDETDANGADMNGSGGYNLSRISSSVTSFPATVISPAVTSSSPETTLKSVDFPLPSPPNTTKNSLSAVCKFIPYSATLPEGYTLSTPLSFNTAIKISLSLYYHKSKFFPN